LTVTELTCSEWRSPYTSDDWLAPGLFDGALSTAWVMLIVSNGKVSVN